MMHCCLSCKRQISITNLRNFQCKVCKRFCHPNCAKKVPRFCIKPKGQPGFTVVRNCRNNPNWQCDSCILRELPFYDISDSQIKEMVIRQKRVLPSCEDLNSLFSNEADDYENDTNQAYFLNQCKYITSSDIEEVSFSDLNESYENFPIISFNIRSIVNGSNVK